MTSIFSVEGKATPCTIIEVGPCVVTQVKTEEKDGYSAVQLAYGDKREKKYSEGHAGTF
jgi:large subunit ribosomal protein L3